ncbi:MAG: SDR family NAD(P)-dependent oxidoreductase [Lachnospiraceae bacterium]|nr:SDR family NAD(P)-dependent oxidoreductase [Lachnospiraceae bacterium]
MLLENKVALVTGAGRGLGKAIAIKLAEEGATALLTGRHQETLEAVKAEIQENGGIADCFCFDVRDWDVVQQSVREMIDHYGKIDILVNNAGISKEMPFLEMPIEIFDEICEMNLRSVMLMMKAVMPYMAEARSGNVINIGSGAALRGLPGSAAYSAAKAGVVCLTQAVGDEVRPLGIRVNAICPGPVDTELFQKSEKREYILAAGGDLFQPETVANAAVFLASDQSGCMNSQTLVMRGFNRW